MQMKEDHRISPEQQLHLRKESLKKQIRLVQDFPTSRGLSRERSLLAGKYGTRTLDLCDTRAALYQLS